MSVFNLRLWGKADQVFTLDESGKFSKIDNFPSSQRTDGYVKKFLLGEYLIIYMNDREEWFISIGNKRNSIHEIKDLNVHSSLIFTTISFVLDGQTYSFKECTPFDSFSRWFDPTYDDLDADMVFGRWFVNKVKTLVVK